MSEKKPRRTQRFLTLRLRKEDRELLQNLGRGREGVADRYEALCALREVLSDLRLEDVRDKERRPLRIGIPESLEEAIGEVVGRTGQPFLAVLLEAAREYRRRHPMPAGE
jgi:hypothetical protein